MKTRLYFALFILFTTGIVGCSDETEVNENPITDSEVELEDDPTKEAENPVNNDDDVFLDIVNCISKSTFEVPVTNCLTKLESDIQSLNSDQVDSIYLYSIETLIKQANNNYPEIDYEKDFKDGWGELKTSVTDPYRAKGFVLDQEEGDFFLAPDHEYLFEFFHELVSPEMADYLKFKRDVHEKLSYDAGLIVEGVDFAKRLTHMESLLKNGNEITRSLVADQFIYELPWLFSGMDNTPTYEYSDSTYYPEAKEGVVYLKEHGGIVGQHFAKAFFDFMVEEDWKPNPEALYKFVDHKEVRQLVEEKYHL